MRGGGKVNYTSGSLARAKSKSKKNQSPDRPKPSTKALFPQKVLLLTPLKKKSNSKSKKEFDLEETQSNPPTCKEVMTKEDWMRDSDFAMARDASSFQEKERERGGGWWVDYGRDTDGRKFGEHLERILGELKSGEGVAGKGGRARNAGDKDAETRRLLTRSDCLDLPHWLRYLPRERPVEPETPQRP